jgi:hypothetical protein
MPQAPAGPPGPVACVHGMRQARISAGATREWQPMAAPNRSSILISAALAVATPLLAGTMAWRLVDEEPRSGPLFVLTYWPSLLLDLLPDRAAQAFTYSALPTVLLYFGGYLLLCQGGRSLWRRLRSVAAR